MLLSLKSMNRDIFCDAMIDTLKVIWIIILCHLQVAMTKPAFNDAGAKWSDSGDIHIKCSLKTTAEFKRPEAGSLLESFPNIIEATCVFNLHEYEVVFQKPPHVVSRFLTVETLENDGVISKQLKDNMCMYRGTFTESPLLTAVVDVCYIDKNEKAMAYVISNNYSANINDYIIKPDVQQKSKDDTNESCTVQESSYSHREARSVELVQHSALYMEVLVVVDNSVVDFHGKKLYQQYILTQMNIVDNIYHHPSLGVEINIVTTKIIHIDNKTADQIIVENNGQGTLDRFCRWVSDYKSRNSDGAVGHFDMALFITRQNIGPAGFAPVTGMCEPIRSCSVNKDGGFSSSYVIAHEIGHVIGMGHDGVGNDCDDLEGDGKVMATTVQANPQNIFWSKCSKIVLKYKLNTLHCLYNMPVVPSWPVYSQPFGQSWTADEQCRQEFGDSFQLCSVFGQEALCESLWCGDGPDSLVCKTKRSPPLPGTPCGYNKWCMDGRCIHQSQVAVDGGWSNWNEWSSCSISCGRGIQLRYRKCDKPTPTFGGKKCSGNDTETTLCNLKECAQLTDQRAEQCSSYNNQFYHGEQHIWLPVNVHNSTLECHLVCKSLLTDILLVNESPILDGVPCSYDKPNDVCVKGKCQRFACDGSTSPNKLEDTCGVCNGDGTSCQRMKGTFSIKIPKDEVREILLLPSGARNIQIKENQDRPSHSLVVEYADDMYLPPRGHKDVKKSDFVVQGTNFEYRNQRSVQSLTARGPTLRPIRIMLQSESDKLPAHVIYEYTLPMISLNSVQQEEHGPVLYAYEWTKHGWGECSMSCDTGHQAEVYICLEKRSRRHVNREMCEDAPPEVAVRECNTEPCFVVNYQWREGNWGSCSTTCGDGEQTRRIICQAKNIYGTGFNWMVDEKYCEKRSRPPSTRPCADLEPCPAQSQWLLSEWSQCSVTCGDGLQQRQVVCYTSCTEEAPSDTRICYQPSCPVTVTNNPITSPQISTETRLVMAETRQLPLESNKRSIPTAGIQRTADYSQLTTVKPTENDEESQDLGVQMTIKDTGIHEDLSMQEHEINRSTQQIYETTQSTTKTNSIITKEQNKLIPLTINKNIQMQNHVQLTPLFTTPPTTTNILTQDADKSTTQVQPNTHKVMKNMDKSTTQTIQHNTHIVMKNTDKSTTKIIQNNTVVTPNTQLLQSQHSSNVMTQTTKKTSIEQLEQSTPTSMQTQQLTTAATATLNAPRLLQALNQKKKAPAYSTISTVDSSTSMTSTVATTVSTVAVTVCEQDKSFFCKLGVSVSKCELPLYSLYCCYSCGRI